MRIIKKFKRASTGLISVITSDTSIRFHIIIGIVVIIAAWFFEVNRIELIVLVVTIFAVLSLEGVNTILERVIDLVEPRYKDMVRDIKDALAGLVLLVSIGAALVGVLIFWPYIIEYK